MREREIVELAGILVNEHGYAALSIAERRRDQYARLANPAAHDLWSQIARATAHLLRNGHRKTPRPRPTHR
jgi:hypothetical protein